MQTICNDVLMMDEVTIRELNALVQEWAEKKLAEETAQATELVSA